MTLGTFILRNALRNKRRFLLTFLSVTLSLFLLTMLRVMLRGLASPETTDEASRRLVVTHRVSVANMLYTRYGDTLRALPGVTHVTRLLWFGGIYQDEKNFFPQFACDAGELFHVLSEASIAPDQKERFIAERNACVVGVATLRRFGWKLGDRITLMGAMWPCNVELVIRGVYSGSVDETNLFFHHEYFDELTGDQGFTGLFWLQTENPAVIPGLIGQIDALFANSEAETRTETQQTFQLGFVSMLGNVKLLIGSISAVIVTMLVLVTGGTMSLAIRERVREIAVLKAIGFRRAMVFSLILAESFGLALAGGLIACGGTMGMLELVDVYRLSRGLFVNFAVTPRIFGEVMLVAGAIGIASCAIPILPSLRESVGDGLRTVE